MLRIKAEFPSGTYYWATEDLDYDNQFWEGRIVNTFELQRFFQYSDKTGSRKRTISIKLDNRDLVLNGYQTVDGFANQKLTFYYDDGDVVTETFVGRIKKIDSFGLDVSLTINEMGFDWVDEPYPDLQIAYDYYTELGFNESWNAVPVIFGNNTRVPVQWIDRVNSRFTIGPGPFHAVNKVWFDKVAMYDSVAGTNGYQYDPLKPNIKVRIFLGTGSVGSPEIVDGITSAYPGLSYIEFYDADTSLAIEPVLSDGTVPQIYVDVEGIQNAGNTAAERNPAQILYNILTKPVTGYQGYGMGIATTDLDFATAIADCATLNLYLDGIIDDKKAIGEWIDDILKCCRGSLIEEGGKIKLVIAAAAGAVAANFDETGIVGYEIALGLWNEPEVEQQINRLRLFYNKRPEDGKLVKRPEFNEESPTGDTELKNAIHAVRIGRWNTGTLELPLVKDDHTAHRMAQYYFKRDILQLKEISFTTEVEVPETLDYGSLITISSTKYGWTLKEFIIIEISRSESQTTIKAKEYDSSIFTYSAITPVVNTQVTYSPYAIPAKPELSSAVFTPQLQQDGSVKTIFTGCIVKPTTNSQSTLFYRNCCTCPDTDFEYFAQTQGTKLVYEWEKNCSGCYKIRTATLSPYGVYSSLAIVAGDKHYYGQPGAESARAVTGDITAPGTPILSVEPVIHGAAISLSITGGTPSDFSHFQVWRKCNAGGCVVIGCPKGTLFVDTQCTLDYGCLCYSAMAVDKSANCSCCSVFTAGTTPTKVDTKDIVAGSITSCLLTSCQIISKDFRTASNVGDGCAVSGIRFDGNAISAYCEDTLRFCLRATDGTLFACNACIWGVLCSTSGHIGGFLIGANQLSSGTDADFVGLNSGGTCAIWVGDSTFADAKFSVTAAGAMKAVSGTIGGFTLAANQLSSGTDVDFVGLNSGGTCAIWVGDSTFADAKFSVTAAGAMKSTSATITGSITSCSGTIAGFTLNNGCISATNLCLFSGAANTAHIEIGTGNCVAGINSGNAAGDIAFWAGCTFACRSNANTPFRVCMDGTICSFQGTVGGWSLGATSLLSNNIILCNSGWIQTCNYSSGLTGWKIDCAGNAEFANAVIRGELRSSVFVMDEIHAVGGEVYIAGASILCACATTPAALTCCFKMNIKMPPSGAAQLFQTNEILRIKTFNGTNVYDAWVRVCCYCNCTSYAQYCVGMVYGSLNAVLPAGTSIISYGQPTTTCGLIRLNGQGDNSPFIDVFTNGTCPWCSSIGVKVRLGQLCGITGVDEYGLWTCNGKIVGGVICSNNWAADAGSCFDLTNGCLSMGGSSYPKFKFDGTNLCLRGFINVTGGQNSLINNHALSGQFCGWSGLYQGMVPVTFGAATVCAHEMTGGTNMGSTSDYAEIDPTQIYKLNIAICTLGNCTCGTNYWGIYALDANCANLSVIPVCIDKTTCDVATNNFYMWTGDTTAWCCFETFLYPTGITSNNVPTSTGALYNGAILPTNTKYIQLRYLNYYHCLSCPTTAYFYCPNIEVYTGNNKLGIAANKVAPINPVTPSGAGLYLGCDYLGYYDATRWRALINNSGHLCLAKSDGTLGLQWDGTDLTVRGAICSIGLFYKDYDGAHPTRFITTDALCNNFIGDLAGNTTLSGAGNTGVGNLALCSITTGDQNVAVGSGAGKLLTSGCYNTFIGELSGGLCIITGMQNTGVGEGALYQLTTGECNTAIGTIALRNLTTGTLNTAVGNMALRNAIDGSCNTAVGVNALCGLTSGCYNVAVGAYALGCCALTGLGNIGIGDAAAYTLTTGCYNIALGMLSMGTGIVTGSDNIGMGQYSLNDLTSGACNVMIGQCSGMNLTTGKCNTGIGTWSFGLGIVTGYDNTAVGYYTGLDLTSGYYNSLVGAYSGASITTGIGNTLAGVAALYCANTSCYNTVIGFDAMRLACQDIVTNCIANFNTAIGVCAMRTACTGCYNVAVGASAMLSGAITGNYNVGVGYVALQDLTTGVQNAALGDSTLTNLTTGCYNTAVGSGAIYAGVVTGNCNTAVGRYSMNDLTCGSDNVAVGRESAFNLTSASANVAVGTLSMGLGIVTGGCNTAVGYCSMYDLTTGVYNTAVGTSALENLTTGNYNTAVGVGALKSITTGSDLVAIGYNALCANTTGLFNIGLGSLVLYSNVGGNENIGIGQAVLYHNTEGDSNIGIGDSSLYCNVCGVLNIAIGTGSGLNLQKNLVSGFESNSNILMGTESGYLLCGANCNIFIGYCSGGSCINSSRGNLGLGWLSLTSITSGCDNIGVGSCAGCDLTTCSNSIAIGNVGANVSNYVWLGNTGTTCTNLYGNVCAESILTAGAGINGVCVCASSYLQANTYLCAGTCVMASGMIKSATCVCGTIIVGSVVGSGAVRGAATTTYGGWFTGACYASYSESSVCCSVVGNTAYGNISTKTVKIGLRNIEILPGLRNLCIPAYRFSDRNLKGFEEFVGPMAEDVQSTWGLTFSNDGLYQMDGIALKATQELDVIVSTQKDCICKMNECIVSLGQRLANIEHKLKMCA